MRFDQDNSGLIDRRELQAALQGFGFSLPTDMVAKLEKRFAPPMKPGERQSAGITFDRFLMACVTVKHYTEAFRRLDPNNVGQAMMDYTTFVSAAVACRQCLEAGAKVCLECFSSSLCLAHDGAELCELHEADSRWTLSWTLPLSGMRHGPFLRPNKMIIPCDYYPASTGNDTLAGNCLHVAGSCKVYHGGRRAGVSAHVSTRVH